MRRVLRPARLNNVSRGRVLRASGRAGGVLSANAGRDGPSPRARGPLPLLLLCYQSYYLVLLKGAVVLQRVVQPMSFGSGLYGIVCDAYWGIRESLRCSRLCVSTAQRLWRIGTCRSAPQAVIVVPDYKTPRIESPHTKRERMCVRPGACGAPLI